MMNQQKTKIRIRKINRKAAIIKLILKVLRKTNKNSKITPKRRQFKFDMSNYKFIFFLTYFYKAFYDYVVAKS